MAAVRSTVLYPTRSKREITRQSFRRSNLDCMLMYLLQDLALDTNNRRAPPSVQRDVSRSIALVISQASALRQRRHGDGFVEFSSDQTFAAAAPPPAAFPPPLPQTSSQATPVPPGIDHRA